MYRSQLQKIVVIGAHTNNNVFGYNNGMPWPKNALKEEMNHFRETTTKAKEGEKNLLIAGRLTFETIGKVLPGRYMGIITHELTGDPCNIGEGLFLGDSVPKLVVWAKEHIPDLGDIYLIGGEQIWKEGFKIATHACLTTVYHTMKDGPGVRKLVTSLPLQARQSGFIRKSTSRFIDSEWEGLTRIEIADYWHSERGTPF